MAQSLFRMATEGNNVAAAIFWMKARAGWRDRHTVEHGLAPNAQGFCVISGVERADDLSDEQLMHTGRRGIDQDELDAVDQRPGMQQPRRGRDVFKVPRELTVEE